MSNRVYSKRRNPDWLIRFARWYLRRIYILERDWKCTKAHWRAVWNLIKGDQDGK